MVPWVQMPTMQGIRRCVQRQVYQERQNGPLAVWLLGEFPCHLPEVVVDSIVVLRFEMIPSGFVVAYGLQVWPEELLGVRFRDGALVVEYGDLLPDVKVVVEPMFWYVRLGIADRYY